MFSPLDVNTTVAGTGPRGLELGTGFGLYEMNMYVRMDRVDTRCPQDTTVKFGRDEVRCGGQNPTLLLLY